jgi:hypothetical protein
MVTQETGLITWLGGVGLLAALQVIEWQAAVARGAYAVVVERAIGLPDAPPPDRGLEW